MNVAERTYTVASKVGFRFGLCRNVGSPTHVIFRTKKGLFNWSIRAEYWIDRVTYIELLQEAMINAFATMLWNGTNGPQRERASSRRADPKNGMGEPRLERVWQHSRSHVQDIWELRRWCWQMECSCSVIEQGPMWADEGAVAGMFMQVLVTMPSSPPFLTLPNGDCAHKESKSITLTSEWDRTGNDCLLMQRWENYRLTFWNSFMY